MTKTETRYTSIGNYAPYHVQKEIWQVADDGSESRVQSHVFKKRFTTASSAREYAYALSRGTVSEGGRLAPLSATPEGRRQSAAQKRERLRKLEAELESQLALQKEATG